MRKRFLFFLFCFATAGFAQNNTSLAAKDTLYYISYEKLKTAYIAQENTPEAKNYQRLSAAFNAKWQFADKREYGPERGDDMQWIKANLSKTKFLGWEEVEKEYDAITKAYTAMLVSPEGRAFSKLSNELQDKYGPHIMTDVVAEVDFFIPPPGPRPQVQEDKPSTGDVNSPEFKELYKRLNELAVANFKTPATVNAHKLTTQFNVKWKYAYVRDKNTPMGFDDRLEWLEKNWKKTKFKNFAEARKEYEAVLYAETIAGQSDEFTEYMNYLLETSRLYGPAFYSQHLKELKEKHPDIYYPAD